MDRSSADTHQVLAKYEFADGDPEYSSPLFIGSKQECHDVAAKMDLLPGYAGTRHVVETTAVVVRLNEQ